MVLILVKHLRTYDNIVLDQQDQPDAGLVYMAKHSAQYIQGNGPNRNKQKQTYFNYGPGWSIKGVMMVVAWVAWVAHN